MADSRPLPAAERPLAGMLVLDFGQFLAGPVAALRLADLGARVIKVERPGTGDSGRALGFGGLYPDGDSLGFHIMNRQKESVVADLKDPADLAFVQRLVARADVLIHNFRPGVMDRYGLDPETVRAANPGLVYATVSGYGNDGPWRDKPGQDLLAQARSGLMWHNGFRDDPPVPVGISVADALAAHNLVEGILAALIRRGRTGIGAWVETSLLESAVDLQFEFLAALLNGSGAEPDRPARFGAHRYLSAPYGVYATHDGYLALAMGAVPALAEPLALPELVRYTDPMSWWTERDAINGLIGARLAEGSTSDWLERLEPAGIWCAPILTLAQLLHTEAFAALDMLQTVTREPGEAHPVRTTRLPIRFDGAVLTGGPGAPRLGQHTVAVRAEMEERPADGRGQPTREGPA
jgi:CoA:oxalate CoA-transferase